MYEDSLQNGALPPTLREAVIISLSKPDKLPNNCDSYRPLSLINVDNKILAKILASRILPLLPTMIRPDQAGFIPGRHTAHNLRLLFAVMHHLDPDVQAVATLLDVTKPFDSLAWEYLFPLLKRLGLSLTFFWYIQFLYSLPTTRV